MQKYFDFQMFEEKPLLNIPGIDTDVLAALAAEEGLTTETGSQEQTEDTENQQSEEDAADTSNVEVTDGDEDGAAGNAQEENTEVADPNADADSDNKPVGEAPKGNIPYVRFKQEIEKRKAAEEELAALKAKLEQPPAQPPQASPFMQPPAEQQSQGQQQQVPNRPEVMQAVTSAAIRRAKEQMGLSDDDLANMDFADNIERKMQFNAIVQHETNDILETARKNAQERAEFEQGVQSATNQFTEFVNDFQGKPDAADRWAYISEQRFLQLPPLEQNTIKAAFDRLQNRRGTPADFTLAKFYFDQASAEYDAQHQASAQQQQQIATAVTKPPATTNVAAKVQAAQALPKAPQVGGTGKTTQMSAEDVARILNEPGAEALDKLPPDILKKVLAGEPLE